MGGTRCTAIGDQIVSAAAGYTVATGSRHQPMVSDPVVPTIVATLTPPGETVAS